MSTDSGIPDHRGPQGLWRRDPDAEKLVTYASCMADPEVRRRSWRMRAEIGALGARPNAAHRAVAELEPGGTPVRVVTQNVDGLQQLAGLPAHKVFGTARLGPFGGVHRLPRALGQGAGAGPGRRR
ncbi:hypothetical protein GCM10010371_34900 [Streptomyces subrutilus]|uniref:protein acetyllysine N-acetyltransferase n=1 Tax=Streptomyces subrutilus TaxID=36818 RepID=A0A918QTK9_9ACTN|nr:hypothetical protein GCM10010371_34900 [Streptomyces subrutilus]